MSADPVCDSQATNETPVMSEASLGALRLRVLVLALGEASAPPWWRTSFLSVTGRRFCERLFPRSAFAAALHAGGRAACAVHDRAIGRRGCLHLFRLPEGVEREIHAALSGPGSQELVAAMSSLLGERGDTLSHLQAMGTGAKTNVVGAKKVGTAVDLASPNAYALMADVYFSAFKTNQRVFPYAEVEE